MLERKTPVDWSLSAEHDHRLDVAKLVFVSFHFACFHREDFLAEIRSIGFAREIKSIVNKRSRVEDY